MKKIKVKQCVGEIVKQLNTYPHVSLFQLLHTDDVVPGPVREVQPVLVTVP